MSESHRPETLRSTRSFSRLQSPPRSPISRTRASTLHSSIPEIPPPKAAALDSENDEKDGTEDVFSAKDDDGFAADTEDPASRMPEAFEELPIEIRSLTERFLESLSAKVHPTPLSVDALSDLFQDFYIRADAQIGTHIAILSSRLSREKSPAPSVSSKTSVTPKGSGKNGGKASPAEKPTGEQQMLTASEINDRKRARRVLETKRVAWEEAVERALCERVYERIWRHRSTDDEERDQKLRSRTAALSLVGIGLKELLVSAEDISEDVRQKTEEEQDKIRDLLAGARDSIEKMSLDKYPLGKLHHLTAAHKSIVETLSQLFPSSSSADEILPTLIFALITTPPATLNVISDLNFIQRFRSANKVDGEAAYCLVNLEAAISFLETVDLSSLRADELPEGPDRPRSQPPTPGLSSPLSPMKLGIEPASDPSITSSSIDIGSAATDLNRPLPSPTRQNRRLSHLISTQTTRLEQAGDSFRDAVLDGADQAFDTINNTLDNSFKFLFGRLREQQVHKHGEEGTHDVPVPKTLEDARKLVSSPTLAEYLEEGGNVKTGTSSITEQPEDKTQVDDTLNKTDNRLLEIVDGRRPIRDRSVDSNQSRGSGKKVAFAENKDPLTAKSGSPGATPMAGASGATAAPTPPQTNAAVESMRNLGNTLNPLTRIGGMFGRSGPTTPTAITPAAEKPKQLGHVPELAKAAEKPPVDPKAAKALTALEELRKTAPPVRRFMEAKQAKELRIGDVDELLKDYQRLAGVLRKTLAP